MVEKELRKFKRSELIDIIYQLKKNEQKLQDENEELKRRLREREVKIEKIGSLAEAAMELSGIFSAAEEAVAIYVDEINRRYTALSLQEAEENEAISKVDE